MLSNLKKTDHTVAPLIYDEEYVREKSKRPPRVLNYTAPNRRDFDVISNLYYRENTARQREDTEKIKEHVETAYWLTHDYNIVQGEYYNKEKEEQFKEQRALVSSIQGSTQQMRLPPRYFHK